MRRMKMPVSKHSKYDKFGKMKKSHKVWKKRQNKIKNTINLMRKEKKNEEDSTNDNKIR